jgi:hypothetical protein
LLLDAEAARRRRERDIAADGDDDDGFRDFRLFILYYYLIEV